MFQEMATKRVLILGCGNVLMGDDGFGPAVIKKLKQRRDLPENAHAEDVGTSVRDVLFNLTAMEPHPEHIIILDAVEKPGRRAGDVFEIALDDIPEKKVVDYSFHQAPTSNLLKRIQDQTRIRITILGAQVAGPLEEVRPGLSPPLRMAVQRAVDEVLARVKT